MPGVRGIVKFRIDGSHPRQISPTGPLCTGDFEPRWSPGGLQHADLFVMNPDGRGVVQINATLEKDNVPAWGPRPARDDD